MANRKKTTRKTPLGDCYEAAAGQILRTSRFYMDGDKVAGDEGSAAGLIVVHAEVMGQGPMEGVQFGHAFVIDTERNYVIDLSNGRNIQLPKEIYYAIGGIEAIDNYHEYTPLQVFENMIRYRHYGPWDLKTSSGL